MANLSAQHGQRSRYDTHLRHLHLSKTIQCGVPPKIPCHAFSLLTTVYEKDPSSDFLLCQLDINVSAASNPFNYIPCANQKLGPSQTVSPPLLILEKLTSLLFTEYVLSGTKTTSNSRCLGSANIRKEPITI